MIDIRKLRDNPDYFKQGAEKKGVKVDIDRILSLDRERRELQTSIDSRKKELSDKSSRMKNIDGTERARLQARLKEFSKKIKQDESRLRQKQQELGEQLLYVPNPPLEDVPVGAGEDDNVEVRRVGQVPEFSFNPKDHLDLGEMHSLIDTSRGAKVSGARSYYLKNEAVLLEGALMRYALNVLADRGYTLLNTPVMVKEPCMVGSGYFPTGREEAYEIERDGLFLIGTSEVTLVSYHMNELLSEDDLPLRYASCTTCFRREAGSYGKDVRGLFRVHQFQKVEQVIICRDDYARMHRLHQELMDNAEHIVQSLGLPYRVMEMCTAEMGMGQVKKHDIECYMPGRGGYGETHSCSSFADYQSRRSGIRYKSAQGGNRYPFTLNNTAAASPRLVIAIMENYQGSDGSITVPRVLSPYMNGITRIPRSGNSQKET
ncbi:MAG: serine--tRNA ligase [Spirochaetota bacterium]